MSKDQKNIHPTPVWQLVEEAVQDHQAKNQQLRRISRGGISRDKGMQGPPSEHPIVFVTDTITRTSAKLVRAPRPKAPPTEVVYWFGFECGERASVSTLIVPEKDAHTDSILASAVANEEIFSAIVSASLVFLGQVRLMQGGEDDSDDREPGRDTQFDGAFSIEVPPSENPGSLNIEECRIYRQLDGQCRRIPPRELNNHLRVIPGFKDLRTSRDSTSRILASPG